MSAIAVVFAIGAVVIAIGIAVLVSTDAQIRSSFLGQMKRDSDWTARAGVKLTEEAWIKYAALTPVPGVPNQYTGNILSAVRLLSREDQLDWFIADPQTRYSLVPFAFDWMVQTNHTNLVVTTEVTHPDTYQYQIDVRSPGTTDTDNDGVVPYNPANQDLIWNSIDTGGTRQFNAVITVSPNGAPHQSTSFYIFPVKFEIALTTKNTGLQDGRAVNRTVTGLGSCAYYLSRRSFAEYVMFANKFQTETGGSIQLPKDFTYGGPVHTNTSFYFTGNPSTHFLDVVTQVSQTAMFGSTTRKLDADKYIDSNQSNSVIPTFDKGFYRRPRDPSADQSGGHQGERPRQPDAARDDRGVPAAHGRLRLARKGRHLRQGRRQIAPVAAGHPHTNIRHHPASQQGFGSDDHEHLQ